MKRWIPILTLVLAAQAALIAAMGLNQDPLTAQKPNTMLVQADLTSANRITLEGPDAKIIELVKSDAGWRLPDAFDAPAGANKIDTLLTRLTTIKRGFPVVTSIGALKRFKVEEQQFERRLTVYADDEVLSRLYLGMSPGRGKSHARSEQDEAVYSVALADYDLPLESASWLDSNLLNIDAQQLTEIGLANGLSLSRTAAEDVVVDDTDTPEKPPVWKASGLSGDQQLDVKQAEKLVQAIAGLTVDSVLGVDEKDAWMPAKPQLNINLTLKGGKSSTWMLLKSEGETDFVLKVSDKPWYFKVLSWKAQPLLDAAKPELLTLTNEVSAKGSAGNTAESLSALGLAPTGTEPEVDR